MDTTHYPMDKVTVDLLGRQQQFFGDLKDEYFRNLAAHAAQNDLLVWLASKVALAGKTYLDVGANIGVTANIVRLVQPQARICCLEPSPKAYAYLCRNAQSDMRLYNLAAGRAVGTLEFFEAEFLAGSSLSNKVEGFDDKRRTIPVRVTSLEQLCADENISDVGLVKVDVEGFELDVLQGATGLIKRDNPVFVCEFNSYAIAANAGASPYTLLQTIMATFGEFYAHRNGVTIRVDNDKDARDFFYQNMVMQHCVEDIYFGGDASRCSR